MNHVGRSHSQRVSTPRHGATPAVPLRDISDAELSEAIDTDAEQAYRVLHGLEVLPAVVGEPTRPTDLPARISTAGPASDFGSEGAGCSGNRKEAA